MSTTFADRELSYLISYLNEQRDKSYRGFLFCHRREVVESSLTGKDTIVILGEKKPSKDSYTIIFLKKIG